MKTSITLLLMLFSTIIFAQSEKAKDLIREGVSLHDQGKYDDAIQKYDQALALDKNNIEARGEKAFSLEALGKYSEAIDLCKEAIELDPNSPDLKFIYVIYANSEDKLGNGKRSLQVYEEGIAKFPDFQQLYFNEAIALIGIKDYEEALLYLQKSAMLEPTHITTHNAIGRILFTENKIPALFALCQVAIIDPTGSLAKDNFGMIQEIMYGNVKKTGKNALSISLSPIDSTKTENNFSTVETMLAFSAALTMDTGKKSKKKKKKKKKGEEETISLSELNAGLNEAEKFQNTFESICSICEETQDKNSGFYWEYYVPFYVEMKNEGYLEAFSYLVYYSTDEKYVKKWIEDNPTKVDQFYSWVTNYDWK